VHYQTSIPQPLEDFEKKYKTRGRLTMTIKHISSKSDIEDFILFYPLPPPTTLNSLPYAPMFQVKHGQHNNTTNAHPHINKEDDNMYVKLQQI
jgi:hypothetical protein